MSVSSRRPVANASPHSVPRESVHVLCWCAPFEDACEGGRAWESVSSPPLLLSAGHSWFSPELMAWCRWSLDCSGSLWGKGARGAGCVEQSSTLRRAWVTAGGPLSLTARTPLPRPRHPGRCCAAVVDSSDCGPHQRSFGGKPLHSA